MNIKFQLTRSRGAWHRLLFVICIIFGFQLTRSRGAWQHAVTAYSASPSFQLTRSRGAWPQRVGLFQSRQQFQLTRSRGAWLVTSPLYHFTTLISTHTLTWSVTFAWKNLPDTIDISTHTLTWSVTMVLLSRFVNTAISTHTLTWSVTWQSRQNGFCWPFQLTRSRGAWQLTLSNDILKTHFNSHAHVERDLYH